MSKLYRKHIQPKTPAQQRFLDYFDSHDLVVAAGPAGVGKSYLAVNAAVNALASKGGQDTLVLVRPNVSTGRSLGYLPGTAEEKLQQWLQPMINELKQRLSVPVYESMVRNGAIRFQPLESIRGNSFENAILLVDEAQNATIEEIKSLVTRLGEHSKAVLLGDITQRDLRDSGLEWLLDLAVKYPELDVPLALFGLDDVVRSGLVHRFVTVLAREAGSNPYEKYSQ